MELYRKKHPKRQPFKAGRFFEDTVDYIAQEQGSKLTYDTVRTTYYRAKSSGYFSFDENGWPSLTDAGKSRLTVFNPKELDGAYLMVIFDIEEKCRGKRDHLRRLLRILKFRQVQKSVWISKYDSRQILTDEIEKLELEKNVQLFEALKL